MEYVESIVQTIEKVFDLSEEKLSSLTVMLSNIEAEHIYRKFLNQKKIGYHSEEEIISKINLLNALLEIVLENPNMDLIESVKRKELVNGLCGTVASLYEQILNQIDEEKPWDCLQYVVMYAMLSYMADCQTISDLVIKDFHVKLIQFSYQYDDSPVIKRLEYDVYYLITYLMSNIRNQDAIIQLNSLIDRANAHLALAQDEEMKKEEMDISTGLKIGSFGNIIYLTTLLKDYLFAGKISGDENQDIYSVIDMYSFNAFHLLNNESIELRIIGHLLRYAYTKVAENSIWNIAEKSPLIRKCTK